MYEKQKLDQKATDQLACGQWKLKENHSKLGRYA